jgi:hypothetical protein
MNGRSRVWLSALPFFLKAGVAGAAEAMANDDGTYRKPLTVQRLVEHDYNGTHLSERTVQYQLRALEAVGVLVVSSAATGRGYHRVYRFNVDALATITVGDPRLKKGATTRRKCATEKGATEGCNGEVTKGCNGASEKGATKGAEKGATKGATDLAILINVRTTYQGTQAPAFHAGPAEPDADTTTMRHADQQAKGEADDGLGSTIGSADLLADDRDDSQRYTGASLSDWPGPDGTREGPTRGAGVLLHERADPQRDRSSVPRPVASAAHRQGTLGPFDVSAPTWDQITAQIQDARNKAAAARSERAASGQRRKFG